MASGGFGLAKRRSRGGIAEARAIFERELEVRETVEALEG